MGAGSVQCNTRPSAPHNFLGQPLLHWSWNAFHTVARTFFIPPLRKHVISISQCVSWRDFCLRCVLVIADTVMQYLCIMKACLWNFLSLPHKWSLAYQNIYWCVISWVMVAYLENGKIGKAACLHKFWFIWWRMLGNFWNDESSFWRADSGNDTGLWVVFLVQEQCDCCWGCQQPGC